MKIDLKTKNKNLNLEYKKILLYILFFSFIFSLFFNSYLKANDFFNLKKEYEKLIYISNTYSNYQNKYKKKREEILHKKNNQVNWGMIFFNIYSKVPENIFITKIKYSNAELSIIGTTNIKNNIFIFSEELKKLDFCTEVFVDDIQNGSKILYTINILLSN